MRPSIHRPVRLTVASCLALAVFAGVAADTVGAGESAVRDVRTRKIAPGLTFTRIAQKRIPRRIFVLRMDPSQPVTLDVTLARNRLPASAPVSDIARRAGALAAVNGDFGSRERPTHVFAQDGDLLQTADRGALFALRADESGAFLGTPKATVSLTNSDSAQTWRIPTFNRAGVALGEYGAWSPLGGGLSPPPAFACSARLLPEGEQRLLDVSVARDYVVDETGCSSEPMARNGGVVIAAEPATDEATALLALARGTRMELRWTLGWSGVLDVVGGLPILVRDGKLAVAPCSGSFCGRNPRTAIGWTNKGEVLLVVVDGRQRRWSRGASLVEMARLMRDLGAVQALNLDGGGSSTMVVENEVVNRPSDGHQRRISNAVVVLPGPDPGET